MKRKMKKFRHWLIKGILCLMWIAVVYQAVVYFVTPVRAESYRLAVEYWRGVWSVLF